MSEKRTTPHLDPGNPARTTCVTGSFEHRQDGELTGGGEGVVEFIPLPPGMLRVSVRDAVSLHQGYIELPTEEARRVLGDLAGSDTRSSSGIVMLARMGVVAADVGVLAVKTSGEDTDAKVTLSISCGARTMEVVAERSAFDRGLPALDSKPAGPPTCYDAGEQESIVGLPGLRDSRSVHLFAAGSDVCHCGAKTKEKRGEKKEAPPSDAEAKPARPKE